MSTKSTAIEIIDLMRAHGLKLCFAESCTAGGVPKIITSVPGSSAVFLGGITAYHNQAIAKTIDVSMTSLERMGAVSMVVTDMLAIAARRQFDGDLCIATTGYLGPFNDEKDDHPEGYVVVRDREGLFVLSEELTLVGRREANRQAMLTAAFDLALKSLRRKFKRDAERVSA